MPATARGVQGRFDLLQAYTTMTTTTQTIVQQPLAPSSALSPAQTIEPSTDADLISDLHVLPVFENKYAERQWAKEHMAAAFRVFAKLGYADGAGGHISLRDPVNPNHFWISEQADRSHLGLPAWY